MENVISLAPKPPRTVYEDARALITEMEGTGEAPARIVIIAEMPEDVVVSVTGGKHKPTDIAGLCFAAASMAVE